TGARYLLPTLPFLIMLVAGALARWAAADSPARLRRDLVAALLLWNAASVAAVYPSFLSYFNEAVGGGRGGSWYLVDTDCEWGQDAKRLGWSSDSYAWLAGREPITVIGNSIFVYEIR